MSWKARPTFWIILICVTGFAAQCLMTAALWDRLTFEEIAESIRNPYWVANRDLYDGISSNVIYYKALDLYYRISGFHLFAAKEFRLVLSLLSAGAIGLILYSFARFRLSTGIASLAWFLSPTLLYFGTHQASFGIDLQVIPVIALFWLWSHRTTGFLSFVLFCLTGFMVILLAGMFPPGLFYLPALLATDLVIRCSGTGTVKERVRGAFWRMSSAGAGILAGLMVPFLLVDRPGVLFYDEHTGAGLFRGGGKLSLNPFAYLDSVWRSIQDLFILGDSYQFALPHPEFGTVLAVGSFLVASGILIWSAWRLFPLTKMDLLTLLTKPNARIALFAVILLATFLVAGHLSPNLPGLRRSAGMLVALYLLYFIAVDTGWSRFPIRTRLLQVLVLGVLVLLPVSHLYQLTRNYKALPVLSHDAYPKWLKSHSTAPESLDALYSEVRSGRPLQCDEVPPGCRYSAAFAALQLHHRSKLGNAEDLQVFAEDPKTGLPILVERSLWEDYHWIH